MNNTDDLFIINDEYPLELNPSNGDQQYFVSCLSLMDAQTLKHWIDRRAEEWRLVDFIKSYGLSCDRSDIDGLISYVLLIITSERERVIEHSAYKERLSYYKKHRKCIKSKMLHRGDIERCALCGSYHKITIDHIYPLIRGGSNNLDNLQFLCRSCNSKKSSGIINTPHEHSV